MITTTSSPVTSPPAAVVPAAVESGASLSPQTDVLAVTPSHRRLSFLDSVRGIAALSVLVQHYGTARPMPQLSFLQGFDLGQFGVVAFFLVSGFIIPVSMLKHGSLLTFWRSRFFRLYPMYWFSLAVALALGFAHKFQLQPAYLAHPVRDTLANVTMMQRFVGLPDANGPYWTLALELVFYLLCSALFLTGALKRPVRNAVIAIAAVFLLDNALALGLHRSPPAMHMALLISAFIGTIAYNVHKGLQPVRSLAFAIAIALPVILEGFYFRYQRFPQSAGDAIPFHTMIASWVAGYALFFLCFALRSFHFPRALQWLGEISYSLYLIHLFIIPLVPMSVPPLLWMALCSLLAVFFSFLTYHLIERPAMKLNPA